MKGDKMPFIKFYNKLVFFLSTNNSKYHSFVVNLGMPRGNNRLSTWWRLRTLRKLIALQNKATSLQG